MSNELSQKLANLRAAMADAGVDGFIIPRADEYQGEYIPDSADRLRWVTGFTGSAGIAIILKDKAALLSDGRYTIQLKQQIPSELFETGDTAKVSAADWILENAGGAAIGFDPKLHTPREVKVFTDKGVNLKAMPNLVDQVWDGRPKAPAAKVEIFPENIAGVGVTAKLDRVAESIAAQKADAAIIALPDSIAWLLNIRSNDIAHIPVALSYGIARADGMFDWFIDAARVGDDVRKFFGNRVSILAPDALENSIAALSGKRVLIDGRRTSIWFVERMKAYGVDALDAKDPVIDMKARKNEAEQAAMRRAHVRDGVAVTRWLKWFSENVAKGGLTELSVEAKLEEFRRMAPEWRDSSFDTIAGFGGNGAIVHYRATDASSKNITGDGLLLLDSGAQYADGTTDITRTVSVGHPSDEMKENFTLVLKGHIAVAMARFPIGTTGAQIDALARAPLWQRNLDYAHGTGHGVGCYLSVHEEAASLSPRGVDAVQPGMILSNEPGYYKENEYGIRIENLLLAREDGMCQSTGKTMIAFETLTLAPIDKNLVVEALLSKEEKIWLARYHKRVFSELSLYLDDAERDWLEKACA